MRHALVICFALLAFGEAGLAQQSRREAPFGLPAMPLMCHEQRVIPRDSAAYRFDFIDGDSSGTRRTGVSYDSAGVPRAVVVTLALSDSSEAAVRHLFLVRLWPYREGFRLRLLNGRVDQAFAASAGAPPDSVREGGRLLDDKQLDAGAALGTWLWGHRCSESTTSPSDSGPAQGVGAWSNGKEGGAANGR